MLGRNIINKNFCRKNDIKIRKKIFCNILNICLKGYHSRRVVVTGMGCVTPLGINKGQSFDNLRNMKSGIRDLSGEPYANSLPSNCKIGATVPKEFDPSIYKTLVSKIL